MEDHAAEAGGLTDCWVWMVARWSACVRKGEWCDTHTDVQRVVVAAESEGDGLFRRCLLLDHVVRLTVFGDGFALGRASNVLREFLPSGLGP